MANFWLLDLDPHSFKAIVQAVEDILALGETASDNDVLLHISFASWSPTLLEITFRSMVKLPSTRAMIFLICGSKKDRMVALQK